MTEKTKNFIERFKYKLKQHENKKYNIFLKPQKKKKMRICPPPWEFDYPIYKELKDVIICNNLSKICPRRWDELEINFNNNNQRFSSHLNTNVIRITNQYNYNVMKNKDRCVAIPYNGVLHKTLDTNIKQYINDYVFIQISRKLIQGSGYKEKYDINFYNLEDAIKFVLSYIFEDIENSKWKDINDWIEYYQKFNIDLQQIIYNYSDIKVSY